MITPVAEQVLGRLLAVVRPAEDGREDEGQQADGQDDRPDGRQVLEGGLGERGALQALASSRRSSPRRGRSSRTRRPCPRRCRSRRRAPGARGSWSARPRPRSARCPAPTRSRRARARCRSAWPRGRRRPGSRPTAAWPVKALETIRPSVSGTRSSVHHEQDQAAEDVEDRHERHQLLAHAGDRLDAAEDHDRGEHRHHRAGDPRRDAEGLAAASAEIELACTMQPMPKAATAVSAAKTMPSQLAAQAALEHVHGAAGHRAVGRA